MKFYGSILSVTLLFVQFSFAQKLSRTEEKIVDQVRLLNEESIDFLEKVVNINSGSLNLEGVKAVGAAFRTEFDAIGFKTQWIDMPEEMNRAGHLFASIEGTKGKRLLLIGHLDTVFEKNSPFQAF
ncbi:MAG: M20 family peptidase, partial [Flavobacteriaceae bacterium]